MYAIVEIAGHQYKVEKGQKIYVQRLNAQKGDQVEFENVLLTDNGKLVKVGTPHLKGSKITAEIIDHVKGDKIKVFKKKRRKGYQKLNGHRQQFSFIEIKTI